MIIRRKHNSAYTVVPNAICTDERLTIEARWLMWYLLTKPDNWTVRVTDIRKVSAVGRNKAYEMVRQCIDTGYIVREKHADGTVEYLVKDEPNRPVPEIREEVFPDFGEFPQKPDPEKPDPQNRDVLVKTDYLLNPEEKKGLISDFPKNKEKQQKECGQEGDGVQRGGSPPSPVVTGRFVDRDGNPLRWVENDDDVYWPKIAERWHKERGSHPIARGSKHETGVGVYVPAAWLKELTS